MTHLINLTALTKPERRRTSRRFVLTILDEALAELKLRRFYVEIDVVTDGQIRRVNQARRGKDKPTDVLSFPYYDGKNGKLKVDAWERRQRLPLFLGNIVIAAGVARRQAKAFDHPLRNEVARLVVHGICHLAGFDHERSEREERRMFALEDRILDRVRRKGDL